MAGRQVCSSRYCLACVHLTLLVSISLNVGGVRCVRPWLRLALKTAHGFLHHPCSTQACMERQKYSVTRPTWALGAFVEAGAALLLAAGPGFLLPGLALLHAFCRAAAAADLRGASKVKLGNRNGRCLRCGDGNQDRFFHASSKKETGQCRQQAQLRSLHAGVCSPLPGQQIQAARHSHA